MHIATDKRCHQVNVLKSKSQFRVLNDHNLHRLVKRPQESYLFTHLQMKKQKIRNIYLKRPINFFCAAMSSAYFINENAKTEEKTKHNRNLANGIKSMIQNCNLALHTVCLTHKYKCRVVCLSFAFGRNVN